MRGEINPQSSFFSYVDLESRIPQHHPIRKIRSVVDHALEDMQWCFDEMYSRVGRPSIPPEQLVRALLLQIVFTIRSERQLMERLDYDLMFRWFVGLGIDDTVWNHSVFSKNRDRLMLNDVDQHFFDAVKKQAYAKQLMSREHFSVDGTLLEACASMKSFKPKDDSDGPGDNFHGHKRSNKTHQSTTDSDSRLFRKGKGKESKLYHMGHLLTENRNGLIVEAELTEAGTRQEWDAGTTMLAYQGTRPGMTVGADKGYDTGEFVEVCRGLKVTPHVAAKSLGSAVDGRTTSAIGYGISQVKRKRIEECFGWMKEFGLMRKLRHCGRDKVAWIFRFVAAVYNVTRLKTLMA
ncbi:MULTISPECIES: IS5 family transposase [unclassified Methylophaga]|jgi:transposase|uniref:IS5 family transposase n=3 Tax=Methylophaga TaxID=40222 RepID=UPI000C8D5FAD|nr:MULTISPECIES: IS5 family transposase [unclassified Methylophaga]MAK65381.1 IS5/IS1182 family transposase [Methylophaga sp.]MAK65904.1 IS5/IS1182 family transposase [Methylophaga sp.]MAY16630.1 IS5/IS1182 family transposase [Methylophaga sp.]MBN44868.1 IS5/IS1182 family transposase [Methylophaga sp.]THK41072.1 IS5 family transposase [Methylophaga sp. SB9B]|tara:strand:- start:6632 stop:7678 length:1047 start_codon:yes stop_codon:yes gene_type:complete